MSQENDYIENDILEEEELEEEFDSEDENDEDDSEDSTDYQALYLAEKEKRERAEKAIIKKKQSDKRSPVKTTTKQLPEQSIERIVLKAQGTSEEQLEILEEIAQIKGISLIEAQKNPVYLALENDRIKQEEMKKERLPASRGGKSKTISIEKSKERLFSDDDLSDEEISMLITNHKR